MSHFAAPIWAGLALLLICTLKQVVLADDSAAAVEAEGNVVLLQKTSTRASSVLVWQQSEAPAEETAIQKDVQIEQSDQKQQTPKVEKGVERPIGKVVDDEEKEVIRMAVKDEKPIEEPLERREHEIVYVDVGQKENPVVGLGSMASLDDVGLEDVMKLNDKIQMILFVRRAVHQVGLLISDDVGLDEFAGRYSKLWVPNLPSKEQVPHDFGILSKQISKAAIGTHRWVSVMKAGPPLSQAELDTFAVVADPVDGLGLITPLNEDGYKAVSELKSEAQMNVFIHRIVNHMGLTITDRKGIMGILPWYSGANAVQTYAHLTTEILRASMLPGAYVKT